MSDQISFDRSGFAHLLKTVGDAGYVFKRLDSGAAGAEAAFYLRHDVDISPALALQLGKIECDHGAVASFFFQMNAETYSLFSKTTLGAMRSLRDMGHCVGLHIDQELQGEDEDAISTTLDWFNAQIAPIDRVVSFHRPAPSIFFRRYRGFVNAYQDGLFDRDTYASDSRRNAEFWPRVQGLLAARASPIQLLLHPEWWGGHRDAMEIWDALNRRRTSELGDYMLANFRKVFENVVATDENGRFGL
jgi:hypothetical protein